MIKTPTCPDCGQLPAPDLILADGHQAFCQTDGCPVITWDMHLTARENRATTTVINLDQLPSRTRCYPETSDLDPGEE